MSDRPPIRIANTQAFWGDDDAASARLVEQCGDAEVDYLTLDYLAEVSMSIMARQRQREPAAGYARDFLNVVESLVPHWKAGRRFRIVTNAGGLDPRSCAMAVQELLRRHGVAKKVGYVAGDDVLPIMREHADRACFSHLESGRSAAEIADRLVTANAYTGTGGILVALKLGAEIVITGRVADPSMVVGPCAYEFGWSPQQYAKLAGATVAGHLIECGTQVTGGICTDWLRVPNNGDIGFPIVEVAADGSCIVTKPPGSGGYVNEQTVKEQLLYELGDPAAYLSPDCTVSFLTLNVKDLGGDRVRLQGATGTAPPAMLKVSATYRDGYRAVGSLTLFGADCKTKALNCAKNVRQRLDIALEHFHWETIGSDTELTLRMGVHHPDRTVCERFSKMLVPLVTAGPQGTTGYFEGRPKVREVYGYWPCLIPKEAIMPDIQLINP